MKIINWFKRLYLETKKNKIEEKYKSIFLILDLDYYQYLELQRMKQKELDKVIYNG